MEPEKKWVRVETRMRGEMKKNALDDVDKGPDKNLSALIRRLLKEHHEKQTQRT